MLDNKARRSFLLTTLIVFAATAFARPSSAEVNLPSTPEDHFALAKKYKEKAEEYRKEAAEHREMAAAYKKSRTLNAHEAQGQKNPFVMKMEKHCAAIAAKAEALAAENDKAADYHTMRGKELQGK